ncbi:hypothetical protein JYA63_03440 [Fictibacillus nanhaiensis]|uniref:Uncharacterized protein n=1 Tax=Fictibacillus nanhaiensis TaxID=742169 RepID=A0ABS2ZKA5_9BACL|nr:hypothetical protein [Fictibacillus nanhaiensis]
MSAKAKDKVLQFVEEYNIRVSKFNNDIEASEKAIEDMKLEIKFINEVELTPAIEKRVVEGDSSFEDKLKKKLAKLEAEVVRKTEEVMILKKLLSNYLIESADKVTDLDNMFRNDKKIAEAKAYAMMMHSKKLYVDSIQKEAAVLQELKDVDVQLQQIQYNAGRTNGIYTEIDVLTAPIPSYKDRFNGVYLQLSLDEIRQLIKGTIKPEDLSYLIRFSHKKDL